MLPKTEVIKAIEKKNPSHIPGWYRWITDETWQKYGAKLGNLLNKYEDDIILVDYTMPKDFVETAPGRDEFYIYNIDRPGVFSGMPTPDLKGDWSKVEKLMNNFPDPYKEGRFDNAMKERKKYHDVYLVGHWWYTGYLFQSRGLFYSKLKGKNKYSFSSTN